MTSSQADINLKCYEKVLCNILKAGAVPNHVGFIMDGNRRHAKKNKLGSTHKGHVQGSKSLQRCLLMSKQVGIRHLSFFCFSVQNFNRSKEQVDKIMQLTLQLFDQNSNMMKILINNHMRVHLIGKRQIIREDVRYSLQRAQNLTKQFKQMRVNFCFAYDSIDQIQKSISQMKEPTYRNFINGLSIPYHLDILVRTSNQHRLSNFMLPQSAYAYLCILKQNWPELNLLSFFKIVFWYNYHHKQIMKNRKMIQNKMGKIQNNQNNNSNSSSNQFEQQQNQQSIQLLKKQI